MGWSRHYRMKGGILGRTVVVLLTERTKRMPKAAWKTLRCSVMQRLLNTRCHPRYFVVFYIAAMSDQLKLTALHKSHKDLNANMIPFAGWEMPGSYESVLQEHHSVRTKAGMFDVSHMGRLHVDGAGAEALLGGVLTANVRTLPVSQARYCMACQEDGGIIDDLIVYNLSPERYLVVCNAANREAIIRALNEAGKSISDVSITDHTLETIMIAVQGPRAVEIFNGISDLEADSLASFHATHARVAGGEMLVARTGYTGEDGVELIADASIADEIWRTLLDAGVEPCGLVARDSLRLEASLRLWGNDMDTTVNPFEAGLGRFVDLDKADFVGKEVLTRAKEHGVTRRLVGFEMVGRGIARHGFPIMDDGEIIGEVTSGGHSPTLDKNIGMGYIPISKAEPETRLTIDIRGRHVESKAVKMPFYRRPSTR